MPHQWSIAFGIVSLLLLSGLGAATLPQALVITKPSVIRGSLDAQDFLNKGNDLYASKKYEEAIAAYEKAIQFKPDHANAWNNRGAALVELKRYDEALASSDKALQFKPDHANAWNNRGTALVELKRYDEALASSDKALQFEPDDAFEYPSQVVGTQLDLPLLNQFFCQLLTVVGAILLPQTPFQILDVFGLPTSFASTPRLFPQPSESFRFPPMYRLAHRLRVPVEVAGDFLHVPPLCIES
jgi:FOG: TPR repeat